MTATFKASHRYCRMAPRKARLIADMIRGLDASTALDQLKHDKHRAGFFFRKVLESAIANALQNPEVRASRLVVDRAYVDSGPLLQGRIRFRPGPMGRAMPFRRRTCHLHLQLVDPGASSASFEPREAEATVDNEAEVAGQA